MRIKHHRSNNSQRDKDRFISKVTFSAKAPLWKEWTRKLLNFEVQQSNRNNKIFQVLSMIKKCLKRKFLKRSKPTGEWDQECSQMIYWTMQTSKNCKIISCKCQIRTKQLIIKRSSVRISAPQLVTWVILSKSKTQHSAHQLETSQVDEKLLQCRQVMSLSPLHHNHLQLITKLTQIQLVASFCPLRQLSRSKRGGEPPSMRQSL